MDAFLIGVEDDQIFQFENVPEDDRPGSRDPIDWTSIPWVGPPPEMDDKLVARLDVMASFWREHAPISSAEVRNGGIYVHRDRQPRSVLTDDKRLVAMAALCNAYGQKLVGWSDITELADADGTFWVISRSMNTAKAGFEETFRKDAVDFDQVSKLLWDMDTPVNWEPYGRPLSETLTCFKNALEKFEYVTGIRCPQLPWSAFVVPKYSGWTLSDMDHVRLTHTQAVLICKITSKHFFSSERRDHWKLYAERKS